MKFIVRIVILLFAISITGCSYLNKNKNVELKPETKNQVITQERESAINPVNNAPVISQSNVDDQADILQCQKNLESIKVIDKKEYALYLSRFNELMMGVKKYLAVRGVIKSTDQGTVDAMYKYKTDKVCSEISSATLSALLKQGETLK